MYVTVHGDWGIPERRWVTLDWEQQEGSACLQEAHKHFSKPFLKAADLIAPNCSALTSLLSILSV